MAQKYRREIKTFPLNPISENNILPLDYNAIVIQNTGNCAWIMDNKFTILPGGVVEMGSSNNIDNLIGRKSFQKLNLPNVTFSNIIYDYPRLEFLVTEVKTCECKIEELCPT